MRTVPFALLFALPFVGILSAPARAQPACGESETAIAWSQPPRHDIDAPDAVRWPIDATIRIGYGGTQCPDLDQIELYAEDGTLVPAQVRLRSPYTLVEHDTLPVTVIEVDPVPLLTPRTTYTLIWRAPDPKLESFARFTLSFKTLARTMNPLPIDDFEGVLAVAPREGPCGEDFGPPIVRSAASGPAGCETSDRVVVQVRFKPMNRRDIIYAVSRTSSTPDEGAAETDPTLVALIGGNEDVWIETQADAFIPIALPIAPYPRTDCFQVQLVDGQGRTAGGDGTACVRLPDDIPCLFEAALPGVVPDPVVGLGCDNLGLNGADPDIVPPADGKLPEPEAPEPGAEKGGAGDGCCRVAPGRGRTPWALIAISLLGAATLRRRG